MSGPLLLSTWDQLGERPQLVDTMRRYLEQIACVLRPGSVVNTAQALGAFAAFLIQATPEVTTISQVTRRHIEDFKPWLAARPGQNKARVTTATLAHRPGTLRMFFVRIDEWGWQEAPPRVPMFPGDLPRQDRPLPKALDDAAAAKLLRAAHQDKQLLVPGHRRGAATHRAAGQRVHRTACRRRGPDRRRTLAARPGREAPGGPLSGGTSPRWSVGVWYPGSHLARLFRYFARALRVLLDGSILRSRSSREGPSSSLEVNNDGAFA